MEYNEYTPHRLLQSWIECYWCIRSSRPSPVFRPIFPDGCTDLIFNLASPLLAGNPHPVRNTAKGFIVGNMTRPLWSKNEHQTLLIGIRFHPGGIKRIVKEPLHHFTDKNISIDDLDDRSLSRLRDQIDKGMLTNWIKSLDHFFLNFTIAAGRPTSFDHSLSIIRTSKGAVPVNKIARQAGISVKQMERKFMENVGVGPKQLSQILRFRETISLLNSTPDLLSLSLQLGYSDHAHLTKSFKAYAGMTPTEYISRSNV